MCAGINKLVGFHKVKKKCLFAGRECVCVCTVYDNTIFGVVDTPIYVVILFIFFTFPELAELKLKILDVYCILRECENQETDSL